MPSLTRYLELVFRSKLRLIVLLLVLPLVLSAVDLYVWRSYDTNEEVWVPDATGQGVAPFLGYSPYQTPSQNAARLFSNLLGTQSFNTGIVDKLTAQGVVNSDRDRTTVMTALAQLTITPGAAAGSGSGSSSGGSGGTPGDHSMTIRDICTKEAVCLAILPVALDVFKSQYQNLKTQAAASQRAIYVANLKAAQATYDAAIAAVTAYNKAHPTPAHGAPQTSDPVLTSLQHDLDSAQKQLDSVQGQVRDLDTLVQLANASIAGIVVVDGPKTVKGLYGIKGFRSDNLKTDAIVLAACLGAAAVYLILVAFLDRSVRDPGEITSRLGKPVVIIPAFKSGTRRGKAGGKLKKSA